MDVTETSSSRQRLVRWGDPKAMAAAAGKMSGRSFLEAIRDGKLPPPPAAQLLDFSFEEVDDGRVVLAMQPQEFHFNPLGSVHGGIIATLLDSVMGLAVHSLIDAGRGFTTLEIKVNYLRAVTLETGLVRATGRVIHRGRQTAMAEASLVDESGRLLAQASSTCLLFALPDARPA